MTDKETIQTSTVVCWIIGALGVISLGMLAFMGNKISSNTDDIPLIKATVQQQQKQIDGMEIQTAGVPLIKLQMEFIGKQLEHINSTEDTASRAIEENRNKLADHERRIMTLESKHK